MGLKKSQLLVERERAIEDERRSIEIKAQEVAKAETDLKKQLQEANARKAQAEEEQQKLMRVTELAEREDKVVKMATTLTPADAANVLSGLADSEVARILIRLPEKQAAKILAAMDSKRSARIITSLVR
jgi:flagellar motility protein MotE (MotC chaperone)